MSCNVKLISHTMPYGDSQGGESLQDIIVHCARVSNPKGQLTNESPTRLIKYLLTHGHWSPFEMASVCLEIITTRDIARQILRHRSFSFQEFSQRYADPTSEDASLGFSVREARLQDPKNRQASLETADSDIKAQWEAIQESLLDEALKAYKWAIANGLAKEQARAVLPEGTTLSRMYMHGTLRSWIHYVSIRTQQETQKEHRVVALACAKEIAKVFPLINEFVA